jgi:hypothetical protein
MESLLDNLNNSRVFLALLVLVSNLCGKYIDLELSDEAKDMLQAPIFRRLAIFSLLFLYTKNIQISLIFTIIALFLFKNM